MYKTHHRVIHLKQTWEFYLQSRVSSQVRWNTAVTLRMVAGFRVNYPKHDPTCVQYIQEEDPHYQTRKRGLRKHFFNSINDSSQLQWKHETILNVNMLIQRSELNRRICDELSITSNTHTSRYIHSAALFITYPVCCFHISSAFQSIVFRYLV